MSYSTIEDLRSQLGEGPRSVRSPEYIEKMMHAIPATSEVDRMEFILERCRGKRVGEFGASGVLHQRLSDCTKELAGVDKRGDGIVFDLDDVSEPKLPYLGPVEMIVCGEIIEHLANPGYFLQRLKSDYEGVPVIISVPNAFTKVARAHLSNRVENVNSEHVAWYSYKTLHTLLTRYGFEITDFYWYGGNGPDAQGLIMVAK